MYEWLIEALQGSAQVVTANRRLARVLAEHFAETQIGSGHKAWATPAILSQQDWLSRQTEIVDAHRDLPTRLNAHQSRVLWEKSLLANLKSPELQSGGLVRQAQDAWERVCAYQVPLEALSDSARSPDQRVFASAARDYAASLKRDNWVDAQGLPMLLARLIRDGKSHLPERVSFAGYDRLSPSDQEIRAALVSRNIEVTDVATTGTEGKQHLTSFENRDAELRSAGAWARAKLSDRPDQRLAVVVIQLERDADRVARLVREGLAPGWQTGGADYDAAVNVSYGRKLAQFPAIASALLALDWLGRDLNTGDVCMMLRSASIGENEFSQRSAAEIELRNLPVMNWAPETLTRRLRRQSRPPVAFLGRIAALGERRKYLGNRRSPAQWAVLFDECLAELNWPGNSTLGSAEFQLVNRWRELLNEFARLELVLPAITLGGALSRIHSLAAETVYQPQASEGGVQLMGPLEAAGMEFDALWVAGLSGANWPPQGNPSPLISRQLQRSYEMPDYEPSDTLAYASRVLRRIAASSGDVVFSYPRMDDDAEQVASGLLRGLGEEGGAATEDPGWYARAIADGSVLETVRDDAVPRVEKHESISGGTGTIQRQLSDPFSAFAHGRLGVRPIPRLSYGLPASLRGRLIHAALANLYGEIGSQARLRELRQEDLGTRIADASNQALAALQISADAIVSQLLSLERDRMIELLRAVVDLDLSRPTFHIVGLEAPVKLAYGNVHLDLRVDRIDRDLSGLVILDYKTGAERKFLGADGEPEDMQLVAYACGIDDPVSGLVLVNVDSRRVGLDGAGLELTPNLDWAESLNRWRAEVVDAIARLERGDIRLNSAMTVKERRQFGLLSRIEELIHGR